MPARAGVPILVALLLGVGERTATASDFPDGYDEWAYFVAGPRVPRATGADVGSDREEGGTSSVREELVDTGRGYNAYVLAYEITDRYAYASVRHEARIRAVGLHPLDHGKFLSLFVRGAPGTSLEITARESRERASRWRLRLPADASLGTWTNLKLPVAELGPVPGREPARALDALVFAVVRRDEDPLPLKGRLELALLSFTDDPTPMTALPSLSPSSLPRLRDYRDLTGPLAPTPVATEPPPPTATTRYEAGGTSRLALLLTDAASDWLGLAHGLKAMGVPFRVVHRAADAAAHRAVLAYPSLRHLSPADEGVLAAHVTSGGTLVAVVDGPLGPRLEGVLGTRVDGISAAHDRLVLLRVPGGRADAPAEERAIPLFDTARGTPLLEVHALTEGPGVEVVARYRDDGRTAATKRVDAASGGKAYAWGADLGRLLSIAQNDGAAGAAFHFVNHYQPAGDLFLRFLAVVWREASPGTAVRLRTAPLGRAVPMLLTHDVDESAAVQRAADFADSEQRLGVRATYFLLPKYSLPEFDDDDYIFHTIGGRPTADWWRDLARQGHELASHSTTHASDFDQPGAWPMGTGVETFETYDPRFTCEGPYPETECARVSKVRRCRTAAFPCGLRKTVGGSLLGELRVSRLLVERVSSAPVRSFRSGFLLWPKHLNEALAATGYAYSSVGTCNAHLTHLPYQSNHGQGRSELDVFEFCVASDDQDQPLSAVDAPGTRLRQALDLVDRLSEYGGIFVQLIHPADTWSDWRTNLAFQEALVQRVQAVPNLAHFATLSDFGAFWRARDAVEVDVRPGRSPGTHRLRLVAPRPIAGLSLDVPAGWRRVLRRSLPIRSELDPKRSVLVIRESWTGVLEIDVSE
ncbi:MAG: hypothetical protein ABW221_19720 [Vicinamibacteria bacterium]